MVQGKWVVKDQQVLGIDLEKLLPIIAKQPINSSLLKHELMHLILLILTHSIHGSDQKA
nr:hypothetical protein [Acinetobacter terrae]